jgi:hypothetical protein
MAILKVHGVGVAFFSSQDWSIGNRSGHHEPCSDAPGQHILLSHPKVDISYTFGVNIK